MKVFLDLDGTLWETKDGYIYSYNKTCDELKIPQDKRYSDEEVVAFLGVRLDILLENIIPGFEDKELLGKLLVKNLIEYTNQFPKFYYQDLKKLFIELSQKYELYVLSNCPRNMLDSFYYTSGVAQFVSGDNTIEISEKSDALKRFTHNYQEKAVFVGDSDSDYNSIENHSKILFINAVYGYDDCKKYDFYLENLCQLPDLLEQISEINAILKNHDYKIISVEKSYLVLMEKQEANYFGFLNIKNTEDLQIILQKLKETNKASGKTLLGPINGNSWFNYRIALNEFDYKLYPDCISDEKLLSVFLENGFTVGETYSSTISKLNLRFWRKNRNLELDSEYSWKIVEGEETNKYLLPVFELSCKCFKNHDFYEEISFYDFEKLYMKNLSLCELILIMIFHNNELIGFNFCYPDLENRFFVIKTLAVKKEYRNISILNKILQLSNQIVKEKGFDKILMHFQQDKLKTMQSYFRGHKILQKKYGILKYENK